MICLLCDHRANTKGCFGDLWVSTCPCVVVCWLHVCVAKALHRFSALCTWNRGFTCGWTCAHLCFFFNLFFFFFLKKYIFWLTWAADKQHLASFPWLWRREDPSGPAVVCAATGITRVLWSHRAAAHFAGKERDDVMLFVQHQQMHGGREWLR